MNKFGAMAIIIGAVILAYLVLMAFTPTAVDIISTANTTSSVGDASYYGAQDFLLTTPWLMWFVPAAVGMAALVGVLRHKA